MMGKILGSVILASALIAGAALYYLQVYGFYQEVDAPAEGVMLIPLASTEAEVIPMEGYQAIDADSSPSNVPVPIWRMLDGGRHRGKVGFEIRDGSRAARSAVAGIAAASPARSSAVRLRGSWA